MDEAAQVVSEPRGSRAGRCPAAGRYGHRPREQGRLPVSPALPSGPLLWSLLGTCTVRQSQGAPLCPRRIPDLRGHGRPSGRFQPLILRLVIRTPWGRPSREPRESEQGPPAEAASVGTECSKGTDSEAVSWSSGSAVQGVPWRHLGEPDRGGRGRLCGGGAPGRLPSPVCPAPGAPGRRRREPAAPPVGWPAAHRPPSGPLLAPPPGPAPSAPFLPWTSEN